VRYAAARVGHGSEVLGLDDAMSRDHDWGLRLQLFVPGSSCARVRSALDHNLPRTFRGHPVRFGFSADPTERLRTDVTSVDSFVERQLGFDPRGAPSIADWLSLTGQAALEVVSGAVFEDQTGELTGLREALSWYPDDIWRYVVASGWQRIDQELPLMGRAGERGDELGSRVIAARLVDIAVHLAFMLSRAWPPYPKWRGSVLARLQELSGLPVPRSAVEPFWDRPYLQVNRNLVPQLLKTLKGTAVQDLAVGVGSVEQQSDNVDVLTRPARRRALAAASVAAQGPMTPA
jgi:hypothetical protein